MSSTVRLSPPLASLASQPGSTVKVGDLLRAPESERWTRRGDIGLERRLERMFRPAMADRLCGGGIKTRGGECELEPQATERPPDDLREDTGTYISARDVKREK